MTEKEYIERDSLVGRFLDKQFSGTSSKIDIAEAIRIINSAPTADVTEVKHGKWILLNECANEGIYCSVCHKKVYKTDYANQKLKSNYCPNCGAKMDEE